MDEPYDSSEIRYPQAENVDVRTSSTFRKIVRNRIMSASRFLASRECPFCALFRRSLVLVNAWRVGNTFSLAPVPDMPDCEVKQLPNHGSPRFSHNIFLAN